MASGAGTSLLYSGEQYDGNLDQYYLRARYYNQNNGTFNRVDPYSGNTQDPQSLHKYAYVHNNPVNNIDPTGNWSIPQVVTALAITSFVFNLGITAATSYNIAKDVGTIDGVVVNLGVSAGGKGFAGAIIFSLVW
ncbi:MAG: RHS repeat-associated core domain-containing protein [Planctomycetota bacterium]